MYATKPETNKKPNPASKLNNKSLTIKCTKCFSPPVFFLVFLGSNVRNQCFFLDTTPLQSYGSFLLSAELINQIFHQNYIWYYSRGNLSIIPQLT